jgi:hypothetical protein
MFQYPKIWFKGYFEILRAGYQLMFIILVVVRTVI